MDNKWLDDVLAVAEAGSISKAAILRNIAQPAFSRRIQVIEEWLGTAILDRSVRPARLTSAILENIDEIRSAAARMNKLKNDLSLKSAVNPRYAIATQHTLSIVYLPRILAKFHEKQPNSTINIRSGNRDECFVLLLTGIVAAIVAYETEDVPIGIDLTLLKRCVIGRDRLVPVISKSHKAALFGNKGGSDFIPFIGYPNEVFFGKIIDAHLLPKLSGQMLVRKCFETALVPAVVECVREGLGFAWIPDSMLALSNQDGLLEDLSDNLPTYNLKISAMCTRSSSKMLNDNLWQHLLELADPAQC